MGKKIFLTLFLCFVILVPICLKNINIPQKSTKNIILQNCKKYCGDYDFFTSEHNNEVFCKQILYQHLDDSKKITKKSQENPLYTCITYENIQSEQLTECEKNCGKGHILVDYNDDTAEFTCTNPPKEEDKDKNIILEEIKTHPNSQYRCRTYIYANCQKDCGIDVRATPYLYLSSEKRESPRKFICISGKYSTEAGYDLKISATNPRALCAEQISEEETLQNCKKYCGDYEYKTLAHLDGNVRCKQIYPLARRKNLTPAEKKPGYYLKEHSFPKEVLNYVCFNYKKNQKFIDCEKYCGKEFMYLSTQEKKVFCIIKDDKNKYQRHTSPDNPEFICLTPEN